MIKMLFKKQKYKTMKAIYYFVSADIVYVDEKTSEVLKKEHFNKMLLTRPSASKMTNYEYYHNYLLTTLEMMILASIPLKQKELFEESGTTIKVNFLNVTPMNYDPN